MAFRSVITLRRRILPAWTAILLGAFLLAVLFPANVYAEKTFLETMSESIKEFSSNVSDTKSGVHEPTGLGENTEQQIEPDTVYTPWKQAGDFDKKPEAQFEVKKVLEKKYTTKKLTGLVPPIRFKSGAADIPEEYVEKLREILHEMRDRVNVRVHFIGHTDNVKLRGALAEKYGDNMELSKERAGTTAEYFQRALELPPEAISYEGLGDTQPVASNKTAAGKAKNRRVEVQVWYDEVSERMVDRKTEIDQKTKRIQVCRTETVCKVRYKVGHKRRTKLKNLVPPLNYGLGDIEVPQQFLQQLQQALRNLSSKDNVQMKFIGHTDNIPLEGRDARIYGDWVGLSKARAQRVALAVQEAFGLANKAVGSGGKGSAQPIASNNSERGRALNRRIEVEFWHDDPLEDLPDEPQICPEQSAAETVERIYNPPEGDLKPIYFEKGLPVIPVGYTRRLARAMDDIKDKGNVRLRFIGYTSNERLDRRTAMVYGDDIGLSTARARRTMQVVQKEMKLNDKQVEFEGRGYVQSEDVVNKGFTELDRSKIEVQIVYDELAELDETEGLEIKRLERVVQTDNPFKLNLMRISVDGQPINDPNKSIPDVQRCVDVALDQAQITFKFDNLHIKPRLNLSAWPNNVALQDNGDTDLVENRVHFKLYSNYPAYIEKAEVRIFKAGQSTRDTPLRLVPLNKDGYAQWHVDLTDYNAPRMELAYVLRVYDKQGNFDETQQQTLWVLDKLDTDYSQRDPRRELLVGYGENRLVLSNIPKTGGAVKVFGSDVPKDHNVWFAGYALPLNEKGEFASEMILPQGYHTVEVSVTDKSGNGNVYMRELQLKNNDWFYVGIADVTLSKDSTNGPAQLVTNDQSHYDNDLNIDGRLAFYTKGKFGNNWSLTASADTREGPLEDLFTNFLNKSPDALFRRIDPDYYYPSYGDDGVVEQDAPTSGKFYIKLQKEHNHALWGNFKINYHDNNLAHVDRALYGFNLNYESQAATGFGEKRFKVNLFGAEPGTVSGRDEFRSTSGSLYFLKHQDISQGSDRLRIEVRDAVSGLVVGVKNLTTGLDYDIDYLQGRILLNEPLSAFAASTSVVDSGGTGGNRVFLVARYEYTPGFEEIKDIASGTRVHYWLGDHIKFGFTANNQSADSGDSRLTAADFTWRKSASTWVKLEQSASRGPVASSLLSNDGGFEFTESTLAPGTDVTANGQRMDVSLDLKDINENANGQITYFHQRLDAGYAAPGLIARTDTVQEGLTASVPLFEVFKVRVKGDMKSQQDALQVKATELDLDYQFDKHWRFSTGMRREKRRDNSLTVPLTQRQGTRSDATLRADYDSKQRWSAYTYIQDSYELTGNREGNERVGVGGAYRASDRFKFNGELSGGHLGNAVKLGSEYKMTEKTDIYTNYVLENERTDNGIRSRRGNMASGFKTRYSDSTSIYAEEKYTHGDVPSGLTHSLGIDMVLSDRLNIGANVDAGTLVDNNTAARIDRTAAGFKLGYKFSALTYAGALQYRLDKTEQPDTTLTERSTWLARNSIKYKVNPDWRFIGKLNASVSDSSLGEFYDGNFIEAVMGYAYRPVEDSKLNALMKYTYFYNVPATDQVTIDNTASQFIQKSNIFAVDTLYDLTRHWSLGGKIAYRLGELSRDRINPQFFASDVALYVARADWHVMHRWDVLLEGRMLKAYQAEDTRSGFLMGIYHHLNQHIKAGIGYNFTDFSDDLTDLDYDSQGLFINAIGKI